MATTVYTNNQHYTDIAEAIRNKNGSSTHYRPGEMADAIDALIVSGSAPRLQSKTVTPSTAQQTISYDSGYNGLDQVTVNAISPINSVNSLTVNDATVSVPMGYYTADVSKTVASGTQGTPIATKGTVNNNSIIITPSVQNTKGFISGGVLTGEDVSVSASELVSGTLNIVTNGAQDVTNYASVSVNVPASDFINNQNKTVSPSLSQQIITFDNGYTGLGSVTVEAMTAMTLPTVASSTRVGTEKATINRSTATQYINIPIGYNSATASYKINAIADGSVANPVATKGTVNNNSISVTPSVISTTGYITGGTKTGTVVTVSASELVSGNKAISANGSNIDVTNYATVSVNIPSETFATQEKEVSPTESVIMVQPDSGFNGLSQVTVGAISSSYVGSGITRRNSTSLTASGATVTVPAGYYETAASKSVATMTLPGETSQTSSGTSKLTITPSRFMQYLNIPVGYNSTASYYTIEGE